MSILRLLLVLTPLLLVPTVAEADIVIDMRAQMFGNLWFGGSGLTGELQVDTINGDVLDAFYNLELESPALLSKQFHPGLGHRGNSVYVFDTGQLSIGNGLFVAPLLDLTLGLVEDPGFWAFNNDEQVALLGPGVFDPAFARLLGIPLRSKGGTLTLNIDDVDEPFSDDERYGRAQASLNIIAPEPPMALLGLISIVPLAFRIFRSRARRSTGRV